jgi:hypothetical protein
MKRRLWPFVIGGIGAALGFGYYRYFVPKIGQASAAEIDAVLPAVLKEQDAPDPKGEARYARLLELAGKLDHSPIQAGLLSTHSGELLSEIEGLLKDGAIRIPFREPNSGVSWAEIKDLATLIASTARLAGKEGDAKGCARWTCLGLRYGSALRNSGGVVIEGLIASGMEGIARHSAYLAEIKGWLDDEGREQILALVPPTDGSSAAWAGDVRRDFQRHLRKLLIDPRGHEEEIMSHIEYVDPEAPDPPKPRFYGNLEPVETAHLAGQVYAAFIADLNRPTYEGQFGEQKIYSAMEEGMVRQPEGLGEEDPSRWAQFRYRVAMNADPNSLGKYLAAVSLTAGLRPSVVRDAARQNLLRAFICCEWGVRSMRSIRITASRSWSIASGKSCGRWAGILKTEGRSGGAETILRTISAFPTATIPIIQTQTGHLPRSPPGCRRSLNWIGKLSEPLSRRTRDGYEVSSEGLAAGCGKYCDCRKRFAENAPRFKGAQPRHEAAPLERSRASFQVCPRASRSGL